MFKVNINTPERRQGRRYGFFIVKFEHLFFKPFSTVAIVDFEQVNSWWAGKNNIQILNVTQK